MSDLIKVSIPPNPNMPNLNRFASVENVIWRYRDKTITLALIISHEKQNGEHINSEGISDYPFDMVANTINRVDAEGNVVQEGGIMSEYDYLMQVFNSTELNIIDFIRLQINNKFNPNE